MLALERGQIKQSYILGGQNATLKEMLTVIASLMARRAPTLKLPRIPLFPLAYAAEAVARVTGKEPFITADGLRMAKYRMFFTSAKADRALGYHARPFSEGIEGAVLWFKEAGYLR
jgi:dihydroflavonol-4-reductase